MTAGKSGKLSTTLLVGLLLFARFSTADETKYAADVLKLSVDVGHWLIANSVESPQGQVWPDDVLNPAAVSFDLGTGVAGKVVYFSALHRATGSPNFQRQAVQGIDYLLATMQDLDQFDGDQRRASLYTGVAGIGVALLNAQDYVSPETFAESTTQLVRILDEWSIKDESGVHWSEEYNDLLYGDAGTVLYLSWHADKTGSERALELARLGANSLLARAEAATKGRFWRFRRSKPFNLPNFSHGTAGISFVLATLAQQTGDSDFFAGAQAGFDYLKSIAEVDDGLLKVPYGWPNEAWQGLYEFGWAHGLAGSMALFTRLRAADIDSVAATEFERLARHTLNNIGLPDAPVAPFAEPSTSLDYRFGRAGVLSALAGGGRQTDAESRRLQERIWQHLEAAAIRNDDTAYWQIEAPAFIGGGQVAYTGILHGAAGIGLSLLELHADLTAADAYFVLPDRPRKPAAGR